MKDIGDVAVAAQGKSNGKSAVGAIPIRKANGASNDSGSGATEEPKRRHISFADVIDQWRKEGEIVRIPTGIVSLDRACGGGLPLPRRVLIIGAPSAGKTYSEISLANKFAFELAEQNFRVGIMAVDEDASDVTARFAQMRGFNQDEIDSRDPKLLDAMATALGVGNIRLYDEDWTIENATTDLVAWAKQTESRAVLCVDSIHTVRSAGSEFAKSKKEYVDANCRALRVSHEQHHVTIIATGEMARTQYANEKFAQDSNAMAAAADSRMPEFWAQTLLKLTTPRDCPDIVAVEIAKNRRAEKGIKFWLQLDREHHGFHEVGDPNENPEVVADRQADRVARTTRKNAADAAQLAEFLATHKGINTRKLRLAASIEPTMKWGKDRLDRALQVLENGACSDYSYWSEAAGQATLHFAERNNPNGNY